MKRIVLVMGLLLFSAPASGQSAVASWDPVTLDVLGGPETIDHYTLYYGTTSRPGGVVHPSDGAFAYDTLIDVGNVIQYRVDNLTNNTTYYFAVAAVDIGGNVSDYSAEVSYEVHGENCNNLIDDDLDGLTDCQDDECPAQAEECDGFDNDCDGTPDNNLSAPPCTLQVGVCAGSTQTCGGASGWQACDASSYGADYQETESSCDGLDNDCDGITDEGCPCTPGDEQTCSTNEGECVEGTQVCDANGNWGACDGVLPRDETCDGLDNDCDTQTDEDLTELPCELQDGVCAGVTANCAGTAGWVCDYGASYQENETLCDGLDNDCDGETDEDCGGAVVEGSCGCDPGTGTRAGTVFWLLPFLLLVFVIRRR